MVKSHDEYTEDYVSYLKKCVVEAQDKHDRVLKDLGSCQRQLLFIVNAAKEACHGDLVMRPDDLECIRKLKMALTILEDTGE